MISQPKVGIPRALAEASDTRPGSSDRILLTVGEHIVHIIGGLVKTSVYYIPVVPKESPDSVRRVIPIHGDLPFLDAIAAADEAVLRGKGLKQSSALNKSVNFVTLAFEALSAVKVVKRLHMPPSVWRAIRTLQEKLSIVHPGNLLYGPVYAWTAIISHTKDRVGYYGHRYSVGVYHAPFLDQLPVSLLDQEPPREILEAVFTPEEIAAIDACQIDLNEEYKPSTEAEVLDLLQRYYVDLSATDSRGLPLFVDPQTVAKEFEKVGVQCVFSSRVPVETRSHREEYMQEESATPLNPAPVGAPSQLVRPVLSGLVKQSSETVEADVPEGVDTQSKVDSGLLKVGVKRRW